MTTPRFWCGAGHWIAEGVRKQDCQQGWTDGIVWSDWWCEKHWRYHHSTHVGDMPCDLTAVLAAETAS